MIHHRSLRKRERERERREGRKREEGLDLSYLMIYSKHILTKKVKTHFFSFLKEEKTHLFPPLVSSSLFGLV
jgi:hypothetical protein